MAEASPEMIKPQRGEAVFNPEDSRLSHLKMVAEDVAGKLEMKARSVRDLVSLAPENISRAQFNAMMNILCSMRL